MAAESIESETTGVDWKQIWYDMDTARDEGFSSSQLCNLVMVHTDVVDLETAGTKIQRARELGEIEHDGSQYVLDASQSVADDTDADNEPTPEPQRETSSSEPASDSSSDDAPDKVDILEQRLDSMNRVIDKLENENQILKEALVSLSGEDRAVFDELPELMTEQSREMSRMSRTISKVSDQLDGLGEMKQQQTQSKRDRIVAIQKGLVKANTRGQKRRWRDVDIQDYFDALDKSVSRGYCSTLMDEAATDHVAFEVEKNGDGRKVLAVDLQKIDDASFLWPKKDAGSEGA